MSCHIVCSHCGVSKLPCPVETHRLCEKGRVAFSQREEDIHACLVEIPFPFFSLPPEIRTTVYEEVFQTPRGDGNIVPDPSHHRRKAGYRYAERTVNNGLALLQSCQQVHEEATTVLYGNKMFNFDDCCLGVKDIEVSDHCRYCLRERRMFRDHPESATEHDRCMFAHDGKHSVGIPLCDFVSMSDWLNTIGEANRLKIRRIRLIFSTSQFAKVLGESHRTNDPAEPSAVGGDLIEQALQLLGRGHNLDTLDISFQQHYLDLSDPGLQQGTETWRSFTNAVDIWIAFERIFSTGLDDRLKNALSSIKGIRKLECGLASLTRQPHGSWNDEGAEARDGFREVKECMESGYATRQKIEGPKSSFSIQRVDQVGYAMHHAVNFATTFSRSDAAGKSPQYTMVANNSSDDNCDHNITSLTI